MQNKKIDKMRILPTFEVIEEDVLQYRKELLQGHKLIIQKSAVHKRRVHDLFSDQFEYRE